MKEMDTTQSLKEWAYLIRGASDSLIKSCEEGDYLGIRFNLEAIAVVSEIMKKESHKLLFTNSMEKMCED